MKIDRLIERIGALENPTVLGLDTRLEYIPERFAAAFRDGADWSAHSTAEAVYAYNRALIDALGGIVPCVKVQVAYYEMYGLAGMSAFERTLRYASQKGLITIADVKRNDIGATAQAYAMAYLSQTPLGDSSMQAFRSDFATINPYLGFEGVEPFIGAARESGSGLFVLVRTSNPTAGQFQDIVDRASGKALYEIVGDSVAQWGADLIGAYGYSSVGAVVGATYPHQGAALRDSLKHTFFLVPGYGAQGAGGRELTVCFDSSGRGAIVNASRSILCAHQKRKTEDFIDAACAEALAMRADIADSLCAAGKTP